MPAPNAFSLPTLLAGLLTLSACGAPLCLGQDEPAASSCRSNAELLDAAEQAGGLSLYYLAASDLGAECGDNACSPLSFQYALLPIDAESANDDVTTLVQEREAELVWTDAEDLTTSPLDVTPQLACVRYADDAGSAHCALLTDADVGVALIGGQSPGDGARLLQRGAEERQATPVELGR